MDTREEKDRLLEDYRMALTKKECKYFQRGNGECPFGNKCFYQHLSAEGREVSHHTGLTPVRDTSGFSWY